MVATAGELNATTVSIIDTSTDKERTVWPIELVITSRASEREDPSDVIPPLIGTSTLFDHTTGELLFMRELTTESGYFEESVAIPFGVDKDAVHRSMRQAMKRSGELFHVGRNHHDAVAAVGVCKHRREALVPW